MASISTYLANALINETLRNVPYTSTPTVYVALYSSTPNVDDTGTEISGTGYARQSMAFSAASGGATANSGLVTFPTAGGSWGTVTHWAIKDALVAGNLLYYGALSVPKTVAEDDIVNVQISNITISIA